MLNALSKKLALSPRPHRKLQRQKKALSGQGDSLVPYPTEDISPSPVSSQQHLNTNIPGTRLTRSFDCHHSNIQHSFEAADIMVIVDSADGDNSCSAHDSISNKSAKKKLYNRKTKSDPVNPKLLTVHWMSTVDVEDDVDDATLSVSDDLSSSEETLLSAKSLPTSPVGTPTIPRRQGSWGKSTGHSSKIGGHSRRLLKQSHSFSGLLRHKKLQERRFSLDPAMMDPEHTFWVISFGELKEDSEFEVRMFLGKLGTVKLISYYIK